MRGTPIQEAPPDVLEAPHDGGESGGILRDSIQGRTWVTQGNPISPTIFNVVVDVIARQCVMGVIADAEEWGELEKEGRHQAALFYADYGMVASSDPRWI